MSLTTPDGRIDLPLERWAHAAELGSFEEALQALEEAVSWLEAGRLPLSESLACYEAGMRLAARCQQFLVEAELRVRRVEEAAPAYRVAEESDLDPS